MSSENATELKRGYTTPVLTEYGGVQDLTAGGSGANPELVYQWFMTCATGQFADLMKFC